MYSILFSCLVCVRACYNLHCAVFCFFRHSPSLPLRIRLCLCPGSVFVSFSLCASQIDVASLCTRTRTRFRFSSCSVRFSSVQFVWSGSILNYSSCVSLLRNKKKKKKEKKHIINFTSSALSQSVSKKREKEKLKQKRH